ncbi:MAG: helix-turn-helix domain-containing protein [Candidatus ainarchaeum sp.]|nr:helix-turn-helix domain-containing protein [Candidatus ainarchaeum sp.]
MDTKILRDLGLSENESKVYIALLGLGLANAGEVTKKSEVNRTNVYDALERLIDKGLVTYIKKDKKKFFEPVNPTRLKDLLKEKEEDLDSILPELIDKFSSSKPKEFATIYKGKRAIKTAFEEILKEKKEIFAYGAQTHFIRLFPVYQRIWNLKRAELGIKVNMIYNEKVRESVNSYNRKLIEMKFLPKKYDFPSTVLIYGNKTMTFIWTEQPMAISITSEEVYKSNKNFFDILWKIAKK